MNHNSFCSLLLAALLCSGSLAASFEDLPCKHVWYGTKEAPKEVEGEVLLEAKDVCLLLQAADGRLTLLQPKEILKVQEIEGPLRPYSKEAMGKKLLEEMPEGFRIHTTPHFVICYDTTDAYAKWAGGLYERLYKSFQGFWREKKFALEEPRFPLVALIFQTKASYLRYAQPEIGKSAESMFGYYNVMSNRVVSFDLTGIEGRSRMEVRSSKGLWCRGFWLNRTRSETWPPSCMNASINFPTTVVFRFAWQTIRSGSARDWRCSLKRPI